MKRSMIWSALLVLGLVVGTGQAAAQFDDDSLAASGSVALQCSDAEGVAGLQDFSQSFVSEQTRDQQVDVDNDDVLLAIALANNGANDISWNDLRDVDATQSRLVTATRTADLDREDVFSALALGVDADAGDMEALACVSDVTLTQRETVQVSQRVDLEEDDVLLAIALSNSIGSPLRFQDVADISQTQRIEADVEQEIDVDREDTFLSLALGAGGEGGI